MKGTTLTEGHLMQGTNWVKCSDKMPEKDVRVMAIWNGMPTILCLFSITGLWDDGDFYSCIPLEDVTHWMPLPPMPEGE